MEMLLAILLWIGCIAPQNTYMTQQIDAYTMQHQPVIQHVLSSEPQTTMVWNQFGQLVDEVYVINPMD